MNSKTYTTQEAADAIGITRATLQEWIRRKKFNAPRLQKIGKVAARVWSDSDLKRLREAKKKHYNQGRSGRPRKK